MSGGSWQHGLEEDVIGDYGTYNDVSGAFWAEFNLVDGGTATLHGTVLFDGSLSFLEMSFAGTAKADLIANDGLKLWFTPGPQCCGPSPNPPNSFDSTDGVMTLWGANGYDTSAFPGDPQSGWASPVVISQQPSVWI